jgi:hypothetical protein
MRIDSSGVVNTLGNLRVGGTTDASALGAIQTGLINFRNSFTPSGERFQFDCEGLAAGQTLTAYYYNGTNYRNRMSIAGNDSGETVFNDSGQDIDFRVESNNNANMLFVDGGADSVGIGTSSPSSVLHIRNNTATVIVDDANNGTGGTSYRPHQEFWANGTRVGSIGMTDSSNLEIIADNYNSASINFDTGGSERMTIDSSGNVGIGDSTPSNKLDVNGRVQADSLQIDNSSGPYMYFTATGTGITNFIMRESSDNNYIMQWNDDADVTFFTGAGSTLGMKWDAGAEALYFSDASRITKASQTADTSSMYIGTDAGTSMNNTSLLEGNTFIGYKAGESGNGATKCVAIGHGAFGGTSQTGVTAIGWWATPSLGPGLYSTAVGYSSGSSGTGSIYCTAVGGFAGDALTTGDDNVNIGYSSDMHSSSVANSTCVGYQARAGSSSVSIGHQSQFSGVSSSSYCVTVGLLSGYDMDGGDYCVFVGYRAGYNGGTGLDNVGIGSYSADALSSGYDNTCVGHLSGTAITSGYNNTCIGHNAGTSVTTGNNTTCVGHDAGTTYAGSSNCTVLGNGANATATTATNQITLGNASISSLRCNVTSISSLSDERDKTAIEDIPYGLDFINAMRPVEFTWNRRDGSMGAAKDIGFIAQELAEVEMDFSSTSRTRMVSFEDPEKWEAAPNRTYPILIKAVQELSAKCEALEARIQQLEQGS